MHNGVKKSLYIYLCSLLGVLLFLILHRIVVFMFLFLGSIGYGPFLYGVSSIQLMALEYVTLIVAMLMGSWYGIWVGLYWFAKVYEEKSHPGFVGHLSAKYWPRPKSRYDLQGKIALAQKKLEADLGQLEDLAKAVPAVAMSPEPIKKKIVRKRTPRKIIK